MMKKLKTGLLMGVLSIVVSGVVYADVGLEYKFNGGGSDYDIEIVSRVNSDFVYREELTPNINIFMPKFGGKVNGDWRLKLTWSGKVEGYKEFFIAKDVDGVIEYYVPTYFGAEGFLRPMRLSRISEMDEGSMYYEHSMDGKNYINPVRSEYCFKLMGLLEDGETWVAGDRVCSEKVAPSSKAPKIKTRLMRMRELMQKSAEAVTKKFAGKKNPSEGSKFSDVSGSSSEAVAIYFLHGNRIMTGEGGRFNGDRAVNRVELAKMLLLTGKMNMGSDKLVEFTDVSEDAWYYDYVAVASERGIIGGYNDGSFRPGQNVNTAEFLKMLSLTFGAEEDLPYVYSDVASTSWFAPYVGIVSEYDLFPGRSAKRLSSNKMISRKEAAVAIYRYLQANPVGDGYDYEFNGKDYNNGLKDYECLFDDDGNTVCDPDSDLYDDMGVDLNDVNPEGFECLFDEDGTQVCDPNDELYN